LSRLSGFGRLAGGVAGGMIAEGARRASRGERPSIDQLLLTPGNVTRLAERLSHMRGAAMKLGQMISMDAGDVLPPELSSILASLRERADFMPTRQLDRVLIEQWGRDWRLKFRRFNPRPIAAASIGQVHEALSRDGRELAVKVQYPGVAVSIDADIDNVASLLRLSGLLPAHLDIEPLLDAAKKQLREEADYLREGEQMALFRELLKEDERFVVPSLDTSLTRERILVMSFEKGRPIEQLETAGQEERNEAFARLIELVARELFEFPAMQTDPNFGNYRYRSDTGQIVLLDFGAARPVAPEICAAYRALLEAGLEGNDKRVRSEAVAAGFLGDNVVERHRERVDRMIAIITQEMSRDAPFDFGNRAFVPLLRDEGMAIARDKDSWHLPPAETLFVQRKVSGTALLGARLGAVVNVRGIVERVLARTRSGETAG
jgi:predicted unusual protein kinase regulating ubiquinone biosynthesis (AarF/ABC1/UbiB family)